MTMRRSRAASPTPAGRAPQDAGPRGEAEHVARHAPQQVRLIGGRFKRTPLSVPTWPGLRPTSSRVRETLFNWLGQDLSGWRVLDAFAGTGALGLEAASRGAASVVMLERETALVRHIQGSVQKLKAEGVTVQSADAIVWMRQQSVRAPAGFDLVFLDPPFDADLFEPALRAAQGCVPPGGWLYLESPTPWVNAEAMPPGMAADNVLPPGLNLRRHGKAGAVHYHLIERVESPVTIPEAGA